MFMFLFMLIVVHIIGSCLYVGLCRIIHNIKTHSSISLLSFVGFTMEIPFEFIGDITDKKNFWKLVVRVKDKWIVVKDGKEQLELVIVDYKVVISKIFIFLLIHVFNKFECNIFICFIYFHMEMIFRL